MKYFLLTLLILPSYVSASCQDTIKSNNFMLFIDTNESELEIATAEKAACARGEKILVVPKNYKEYRGIIKNIHQAEKDYTDCVKKKPCPSRHMFKRDEQYGKGPRGTS